MAYKKGKGKMARKFKKIEPAVQTLSFFFSVPKNTTVNQTLDLSQCASLVNRRFYRQGINWAVSGIKVLNDSAAPLDGSITVQKLPDTWVMSNAWEKGFRAWMRMTDEAMDETQSVKPRFMDFKIYADSLHHSAGYDGNLLPISSVGPFVNGEWEASKMVIPNTPPTFGLALEREILAVGPNYPGVGLSTLDAVSLIEGYASSRALPNVLDPNTPDDAESVDGPLPQNWIQAVFNDGLDQDAQVIDDMREDNNIAPYPFENDGVNPDTMYPGGANQGTGLQVHDTEYITGTTVGGTSRLKGGMFPCGLVRFVTVNNSPDVGGADLNFTLLVDLVPGNHRGYLCEPMTDM